MRRLSLVFLSSALFICTSCKKEHDTTANTSKVIDDITNAKTKGQIPDFTIENRGQFGNDYELVEFFYDDARETAIINKEINVLRTSEDKWFSAIAITDINQNLSNQSKAFRISQLYIKLGKMTIDLYTGRGINERARDTNFKKGVLIGLNQEKEKLLKASELYNKSADYYSKAKLLLEFASNKAILKGDKFYFKNTEDSRKYFSFSSELDRIIADINKLKTEMS